MALNQVNKSDVLGIEPKHITYIKAQDGSYHDLLVAKVVLHMKDGRKIPDLFTKQDYQRPYWVTQKGRQNHEQKKDFEHVKYLQKYSSKQIDLSRNIARTLGDFSAGPNPPLRRLARSPYLYGSDVSTPCLLKYDIRKRYGDLVTQNTVAAGDIETNVHSEAGEIICMSVTHKSKVALAYLRSWIDDVKDPVGETLACADEYIGDILKARDITIEVTVHDTPGQLVCHLIQQLHEWRPDFFTFWNMDFDISNIKATLELEGIDPAEVFSDPSLPPAYRYFDYREGQTQKVTASGKTMSINIEDRWGWVTHPATFQVIDSLPVYRLLRLAEGKEPSYALDAILAKTFEKEGFSKLKFKETSHLNGLRWHQVMQKDHKIKYGVYNIYDSILLELLDEKTKDLASKITTSSKYSDYKNFNSNPKRLCDDMHFWFLDREGVIASSSDQARQDIDKYVIGADNWIITLPSYMVAPVGGKIAEEFPDYKTMIFSHCADLD